MSNSGVWVFAEKTALLAELIGGARALADRVGGSVSAVVAASRAEAEHAAALGADEVLFIKLPENRILEDSTETIVQLVAENNPALILIGSSKRAKVISGRLAARLGTTTLTDVSAFIGTGEDLQAVRMIYGGGATRVEKINGPVMLATIAAATFEAISNTDGKRANIIDVPFIPPKWEMTICERRAKPVSSVNLTAAKRIVSVGRGIKEKEDLAMVEELAKTMDAEIGCSRPVAEGLNFLPTERYIGVSGTKVKPDLYIAAGISGQVQHLIGIGESKIIVAINKDAGALIFKQCDYGIIGDIYKVIPALTKALEARK